MTNNGVIFLVFDNYMTINLFNHFLNYNYLKNAHYFIDKRRIIFDGIPNHN